MGKQYDVIVIGGGASGMMAAGRAAERGLGVLLLEKNNRLGLKLSLTGGGRCNICNAEEDIHNLLSFFGEAKSFLYSSFSQFGVSDVFHFFESRGLRLKIEATKRVFPVTERAEDVVRVLQEYLNQGKVDVRLNSKVDEFLVEKNKVFGVLTAGKEISAESFILATGGKSHPETGSTGDAFTWLSSLGHQVEEPSPSVVPLAVSETWLKSLAGIAFDNAEVTFFVDTKKAFSVKGKILCTHFGLSGPVILNAAGAVSNLLKEGFVTASIDTYPDLDFGSLDFHITQLFDANKNRDLKNVMKIVAPKGTSTAVLELLPKIPPDKKVHSVTKAERKDIVDLLKALPVTISGLMGYERAVIADGGLQIRDVDGRTMRSRKYNNLYVTGDLLDISRPSGGFSLQLCWTTGWVAGNNAR